MNESLDVARGFDGLGDGHGNANVGIFEVLFLLVVDLGADAADNDIAVAHSVAHLALTREIIKSHEGLVAQICGSLQFFKTVVPDGGIAAVGVNALSADFGQGAAEDGAERAGTAEHGGLDAGERVATTLIVDLEALGLVEALWHVDNHTCVHMLVVANLRD